METSAWKGSMELLESELVVEGCIRFENLYVANSGNIAWYQYTRGTATMCHIQGKEKKSKGVEGILEWRIPLMEGLHVCIEK